MRNFLRKNSIHNPYPSLNSEPLRVTQEFKKGKFLPKISSLKRISRRWILLFSIVVIAIIVVFVAKSFGGQSTKIIPIAQSKTAYIGKSIEFPVLDDSGKPTDLKLVMNMTNAELINKILIQGQPATAREGKIFLILNLEISNSSQKNLVISPVNLIRLVDSSGKLYAPDVHNNEVTVEAISTKKTRVGFVIDQGPTKFKIQIGKVDGPKELIEIKF